MRGENINLPVCVCVCVCLSLCPSHFLSTRLQVRPLDGFLQQITDADLCKDVPFGGLNDGFKGRMSPKTAILGPE